MQHEVPGTEPGTSTTPYLPSAPCCGESRWAAKAVTTAKYRDKSVVQRKVNTNLRRGANATSILTTHSIAIPLSSADKPTTNEALDEGSRIHLGAHFFSDK